MAERESSQAELFDLSEVEGYASLSKRERVFVECVFAGLSRTEAARRAGYTGDDDVLAVTACRVLKRAKVGRLMGQAWSRSGADVAETLRQTVELQRRAYFEAVNAPTAERRRESYKQWIAASTLLASIHGRLNLNVRGTVVHAQAITPEMRAELERIAGAGVPMTVDASFGGRLPSGTRPAVTEIEVIEVKS